MKRQTLLPVSIILLILAVSCAPVLRRDLMREGTRKFSLDTIKGSPLQYEGKLFILGGLIVRTRNTQQGSLVEAVYLPVDSLGYLKGREYADGRFYALFPKGVGFLDPEIYGKGREVTIAGVFTGVERGKVDETEYAFPVFEIKQIYLWEPERYSGMMGPYGAPYYGGYPYYPGAFYPPYTAPYYPYWYNDPFWRSRVPPPYWW